MKNAVLITNYIEIGINVKSIMESNIYTVLLAFLYCLVLAKATVKPDDVRNYLGTRTPYRFRYNKDDSKIKFPECKDSKIWMIIRHGTRLPSTKDILGMNTTLTDLKYQVLLAHQKGKGNLTTEQISKLKEWSANLDAEQQKFLTREGQDEMVQLAERMQKRFPNIVKNKYNNETFLFRYTATQRAQQSARYFTIGLFDPKKSQDVLFEPATKVDPVLRFYKHCDKWQKQVKTNQSTYMEQRAFGQSREMNNTLESISKRLGLEYILSLETVILMYKICGFESSWSRHHMSPWCYGFDKDSAQNLEYYHDLQHYWMDGYGYDLTYRQACLSIKNMFETFRNKTGPSATFYFAHSGTILKVFAHLQLFKPAAPLRADVVQRDRPWKTSHIDCFGANLAFVLFKCKDGDHVLTLHQEKIIKLPMCERELCPLQHLVQHFHESIYNCDYSDMCSLNNENYL